MCLFSFSAGWVWNHSLNWKQLRLKPVKDAADVPAFIHRPWQLWLDIHDHLFSISSSLFLSTLLLILRMRWWGPSEEDWTLWYVSLASSFPIALASTAEIMVRRDTAGIKNTPIRSHQYLNIDYRLIDFHVQKKCDSNWTKKTTTLLCVFKIKLTDLTINETLFEVLKEYKG